MDDRELEEFPRYSWADIKKRLGDKVPFEALSPMGTALIRVKEYDKPLIGLAIHAGHRVREELLSKMSIDERDRHYEEDTRVEEFISDFPIQMIGLDSRYEYDLNRVREKSVYMKPFESWGKKVWQTPPTKDEREISYTKHDEFHELLDFLIEQTIERNARALIFDMHTYNYQRASFAGRGSELPVFNVATSENDRKRYGKILDLLVNELKNVQLDGIEITANENDIFKKDGAVAMSIDKNHTESLVLPIEIKKIYMNEETGESNDHQIAILHSAFAEIGPKLLKAFLAHSK